MTTSLLLGSAVPFMQNVFPAVPLVQQVQHTPFLILSLIDLCMAIAYLALWRAAPDFRAFRTMGIFYVLVFLQQTFTYFGGIVPTLSMRALAAIVLIEFAGDAMRITRRKWTLPFLACLPLRLCRRVVSASVFYLRLAVAGLRDPARAFSSSRASATATRATN